MNEETHLLAAKRYFELAETINQEYEKELEQDKRTALRSVAAQNYFYASVNGIEAVFAKEDQHSFNHENRMSRINEHPKDFSTEIINLYQEIERNQRNKVTYRGENGPKYENIKRLARIFNQKYHE